MVFELLAKINSERFAMEYGPRADLPYRIKSYIDNNIYSDLSPSALSAKFYFSKEYVSKAFKDEYGKTPKQYTDDRKIEVAKSLLVCTDEPVFVISDKLRYANSKHFSNAFKASVGYSPSEYRKANKR